MDQILVPVSPGELLDRITILRIKSERITDAQPLANVRRELALLEPIWRATCAAQPGLATEEAALQRVNLELWEIEDRIRGHEAQRRFDAAFIELARSVYLRNDERAALKKRINVALKSAIVEEKSYRPYA
jgi:uncharacterized protein DUF6165